MVSGDRNFKADNILISAFFSSYFTWWVYGLSLYIFKTNELNKPSKTYLISIREIRDIKQSIIVLFFFFRDTV